MYIYSIFYILIHFLVEFQKTKITSWLIDQFNCSLSGMVPDLQWCPSQKQEHWTIGSHLKEEWHRQCFDMWSNQGLKMITDWGMFGQVNSQQSAQVFQDAPVGCFTDTYVKVALCTSALDQKQLLTIQKYMTWIEYPVSLHITVFMVRQLGETLKGRPY